MKRSKFTEDHIVRILEESAVGQKSNQQNAASTASPSTPLHLEAQVFRAAGYRQPRGLEPVEALGRAVARSSTLAQLLKGFDGGIYHVVSLVRAVEGEGRLIASISVVLGVEQVADPAVHVA